MAWTEDRVEMLKNSGQKASAPARLPAKWVGLLEMR